MSEAHVDSFRETLDSVARERKYLAMVQAPPIDRMRGWIGGNIEKGNPQFVAVDGESVVGWCDITPKTRKGFEHSGSLGMGVLAEYRRQGLGTALLSTAMGKAREVGLERIELEVFASNTEAISLYERFGFIREGLKEKSRKLDGKYEDLVLMAYFLGGAIPERQGPNFAGHDLNLETERLLLRPFEDTDFDIALPFYQDREFRDLMEGDPDTQITRSYLQRAGDSMSRAGYYFAIVDRSTGMPIGELCLQWMNLPRANVRTGEKVMRTPIGIWDKSLWRKGYGREALNCIVDYAFNTIGYRPPLRDGRETRKLPIQRPFPGLRV